MGKSFVAFGPGGCDRVDGSFTEHSRIHGSDYVLDILLRVLLKDCQSQSPEMAQELTSYLAFQVLHFFWIVAS